MSEQTTEQQNINMSRWISKSWDIVFSDLGNFVLLTLIYVLIIAVVSTTVIGEILVIGPLTVGFFIAINKKIKGAKCEINDLAKGFQFFVSAFLSSVIVSFFISLGFILLIIPGIIVSALYMFTPLFIAEQNMDFWAAMEASRKLAMKHLFDLTVFVFTLYIITLLGILVCGIGVLITIPLCITAIALAYDQLVGIKEITNK
ncbi:hypothetical protein JXQ31_06715 [candidate division KSB1 bacterium]|nr:hypothetical protein [candidate division KSB1 bacterium]